MARAKKKRQKERLHREPIVRRIAELLDTGTPTKWRWASAAHRGLRAAMCLQGMAWALADKRAEEIVTLARHRIGLSLYPSWIEARGPTPESREFFFCQACGGKLEGDASRPYCSASCRSTLWHRRNGSAARRDEEARHRAHTILLGGNVPEQPAQRQRQCRHCREFFVVTRSSSIYCSRACATRDRRPQEVQDCLICAEPFVPVGRALYCSPACLREKSRRAMAERRARLAHWNVRECGACGATFTSRNARKIYCNPTCAAKAETERRGRPMEPYKRACSICGDAFKTWSSVQLTCGPACRTEATRRRAAAHYAERRRRELAEAA